MKSNLLLLTLLLLTHSSLGTAITLGCLYERECDIREECFNDGVFGACLGPEEEIESPDLDMAQLISIRDEADALSSLGYSWEDPFTQCRLTKMVYGILDNCLVTIGSPESKEENSSPLLLQNLSNNQIRVSFNHSKFIDEINPILNQIFDKEDVLKLKVDISDDGKSMLVSYDPNEINESKAEENLRKLFVNPKASDIINISLESDQETEAESMTNKKMIKRDTSKSLETPSFDKRFALKISLFTLIGVVGVAGIVGLSLFIHMRHKKSKNVSTPGKDNETGNGRSSKIIKVQNKRLLHNDSESHVEEDDNAVFEVDETLATLNRQSSTFSGAGDPVIMNIDVKTGHLILGYMEEHFKNPETFEKDWNSIASYEADNTPLFDLSKAKQDCKAKTRSNVNLPYEKSRVKLRESDNDFINASYVFDSNPKHPNYIATISPMSSTIEDFWQMVWEQKSVTIVSLDSINKIVRLNDPKTEGCVKYWPRDGTLNLKAFDVHLVSEHRSNLKYVVRSLYLKKKSVNETRTITQFHFHEIPEDDKTLPEVIGTFLEFRRKVNKSFRARISPVIVHSEDGCGMVGAYILLDMILNRIAKGIRELDIIASLEHLRDQRKGLVSSKEQFKFVTTSIAEEVNELIRSSNE